MQNYQFTKPQTKSEEGFFNTFFSIAKPIIFVAFLLQIPLLLTECFGASFFIAELFNIDILFAAPIGVLLGFIFEFINYLLVPLTCYCIINWKKVKEYKQGSNNKKVGLWMCCILIFVCLSNLSLSTYLSYDGSKKGVEYFNKDRTDKSKAEKESINDSIQLSNKENLNDLESKYRSKFVIDSTEISDFYDKKVIAIKKERSAFYSRGKNDDSYNSENDIRDCNTRIAKAEEKKISEIRELRKSNDKEIKSLQDEFKESSSEKFSFIKEQDNELTEKINEISFKVAIGTIIIQLIYIFLHFVKSIFNRGSNYNKQNLVSNDYFYPSKLNTRLIYITRKRNNKFYNKIRSKELQIEDTPIPPVQEVHFSNSSKIIDIPSISKTGIVKRKFKEESDYYEEMERGEILEKVKKGNEITAKQLIAIYLDTVDSDIVNQFYEDCKKYVKGKGMNPFRQRGIGFQIKSTRELNNTNRFEFSQNSLNNTIGIGGKSNCIVCGDQFIKRSNHQKLCGKLSCKHQNQANIELRREQNKIT